MTSRLKNGDLSKVLWFQQLKYSKSVKTYSLNTFSKTVFFLNVSEDNIEQVEIGNLTSWVVYTFNISQKFNCTGSLQDGESDFDLSSEPVTITHLVRGYGASSDTSGNTKGMRYRSNITICFVQRPIRISNVINL